MILLLKRLNFPYTRALATPPKNLHVQSWLLKLGLICISILEKLNKIIYVDQFRVSFSVGVIFL